MVLLDAAIYYCARIGSRTRNTNDGICLLQEEDYEPLIYQKIKNTSNSCIASENQSSASAKGDTPEDSGQITMVSSLGLTHAEMQRDNDDVFAAVVDLVKAISVLVHTPHATLSEECITRVQDIGLALRKLLINVDAYLPCFQRHVVGEVEMSQKVLTSDLAQIIIKAKTLHKHRSTIVQQPFVQQLLSAGHALALDAKILLDVVDKARNRVPTMKCFPSQQTNPPLSTSSSGTKS
uniref:focal adhesion kinase 1-like n=1 Tax=Myxine glutinosa TaxID=7769 RepID=UPI00358EA857